MLQCFVNQNAHVYVKSKENTYPTGSAVM